MIQFFRAKAVDALINVIFNCVKKNKPKKLNSAQESLYALVLVVNSDLLRDREGLALFFHAPVQSPFVSVPKSIIKT